MSVPPASTSNEYAGITSGWELELGVVTPVVGLTVKPPVVRVWLTPVVLISNWNEALRLSSVSDGDVVNVAITSP